MNECATKENRSWEVLQLKWDGGCGKGQWVKCLLHRLRLWVGAPGRDIKDGHSSTSVCYPSVPSLEMGGGDGIFPGRQLDSQLGAGISAEQRDLVSRWKVRAGTQGCSLIYPAHPGTPIPVHRETRQGGAGRGEGERGRGPELGKQAVRQEIRQEECINEC